MPSIIQEVQSTLVDMVERLPYMNTVPTLLPDYRADMEALAEVVNGLAVLVLCHPDGIAPMSDLTDIANEIRWGSGWVMYTIKASALSGEAIPNLSDVHHTQVHYLGGDGSNGIDGYAAMCLQMHLWDYATPY